MAAHHSTTTKARLPFSLYYRGDLMVMEYPTQEISTQEIPTQKRRVDRVLALVVCTRVKNLIYLFCTVIGCLLAQSTTIIPTGTFETLSLPYIVFFIITFVLTYVFWRFYHPGIKKSSFKDNNRSKEIYNRSDNKISFPLNLRDRFSELPVELSSQILSHVSIREVTRIATLSRHWRNVCLGLPRLDLDWYVLTGLPRFGFHTSRCEPRERRYVKKVNQVLEMYRNQNIKSFHISCCLNSKMYGGDIDRWMNFVAANKGLQSLSLQFICFEIWRQNFCRKDEELQLVSGSFLSQFFHLKHLHLDACIMKIEKEFKLPNLTTLDLNDVTLEESKWQNVLSCSSIIECLWLRRCKLPSKLCIGNNFPCLSFLIIVGCSGLREIEISAWKLEKFDLQTKEDLKCSFCNVPNLEEVYLFPWADHCMDDILTNLAAKAPSLKYFSLRGEHSLMHKLPSSKANLFYSVSRLRIIINFDDGNVLSGLPCLLKCFPQLKKLEMKLPQEPCCKTYELPVPHAHTKLHYIEIFKMREEYIPIAIYLLKSTEVLKRMVVTRASKGLCDIENLHWYYIGERYSDEERLVIQNALIGKASSSHAELIVK